MRAFTVPSGTPRCSAISTCVKPSRCCRRTIALSSGGNRRIIGTYAMLQLALPLLAFALALGLPAALFRNRIGMRAGA